MGPKRRAPPLETILVYQGDDIDDYIRILPLMAQLRRGNPNLNRIDSDVNSVIDGNAAWKPPVAATAPIEDKQQQRGSICTQGGLVDDCSYIDTSILGCSAGNAVIFDHDRLLLGGANDDKIGADDLSVDELSEFDQVCIDDKYTKSSNGHRHLELKLKHITTLGEHKFRNLGLSETFTKTLQSDSSPIQNSSAALFGNIMYSNLEQICI